MVRNVGTSCCGVHDHYVLSLNLVELTSRCDVTGLELCQLIREVKELRSVWDSSEVVRPTIVLEALKTSPGRQDRYLSCQVWIGAGLKKMGRSRLLRSRLAFRPHMKSAKLLVLNNTLWWSILAIGVWDVRAMGIACATPNALCSIASLRHRSLHGSSQLNARL